MIIYQQTVREACKSVCMCVMHGIIHHKTSHYCEHMIANYKHSGYTWVFLQQGRMIECVISHDTCRHNVVMSQPCFTKSDVGDCMFELLHICPNGIIMFLHILTVDLN